MDIYIPPNGLSCADVLLKTTALIHYMHSVSQKKSPLQACGFLTFSQMVW